jgi:predicted TIM-barrel fold metal-dependent hydrolase
MFEHTSRSAAVRARLSHPVIDFDGHTVEFAPAFLDYLERAAGAGVRARFVRRRQAGGWLRWYSMSWEQRREHRAIRPPWWRVPTASQRDYATFLFPKLRHERMDELGLDFAIIYPTYGLSYPHLPDEEMRRACCRAHNTFQAEVFLPYADRLTPVAVIPMHTPREAVEELEFAVRELGMKCVMLAGHVTRPVPAAARAGPEAAHRDSWLDTFGLDSEFDYDPVWAKCAELKVAPTFHSAGLGWGSRTSISNYVYNHLGHFAAAGEALCKSLILGGVTRRFPRLNFTFLEGGAAWACGLFSDMLSHWEKRNREAVKNYDPANLRHEELLALGRAYGGEMLEGRLASLSPRAWHLESTAEDPALLDDWAACGFRRPEDLRDLFAERLYFGCEADDPLNALAFDRRLNPFGARLNGVFSSDIGHWDVPDITSVVAEAFELVEGGLLSEEDFRAFVFTNAVTLLTDANPDFFKGTRVEKEAEQMLAERRGAGGPGGVLPADERAGSEVTI